MQLKDKLILVISRPTLISMFLVQGLGSGSMR